MGSLSKMPELRIPPEVLRPFGARWTANGGRLSRTPPESSGQLGLVFDRALGDALAVMLGAIPVVDAARNRLLPPQEDCVEVGPVVVVGGIRVQNYDVGYRPDGIRFVADSKTLNDADSVTKNSLNMVNDLATEATTVHLRFPYAVVALLVAIPVPCIPVARQQILIETLERLTGRQKIDEPPHLAEAIAFVLWDPESGQILPDRPPISSPLRIEKLSKQIEDAYVSRYKGDPPHRAALPVPPDEDAAAAG
jgi:hypothetical protein